MKHCRGCDETKPIERFSRDRRAKDGRQRLCKTCQKVRFDQYRRANLEKMRKRQAAYRKANPEKVRRTYEKNREKQRERAKERYWANRETELEKQAAYREANREKERLRARKIGLGGHTAAEIVEMLESQDGVCAYCETLQGDAFHVDHMIPLSRGGSDSWDNLALACAECNQSKHTRTAEEFMRFLRTACL